ncbi:MAG: 4Fe-4S dicluster domain-containing protein [candidate division KSB1 bacterium]|nr:4Fe-4S dicluster domain-containing protein [candidate division KSB1 bacterium]
MIAESGLLSTIEDKLYRVQYRHANESHIRVDQEICRGCHIERICLSICPAKVYSLEEGSGKILVNFENCLECGTCWIACTEGAIDWRNPQGGFGVRFQHG